MDIKSKMPDNRSSRVTSEKNLVPDTRKSSSEPSVKFVFQKFYRNKPGTQREKIRSLAAQNRAYEKKIFKLEKEIKVQKQKHKNHQLRLLNGIEISKEKLKLLHNEVIDCHAQINQNNLMINSKDQLIDMLQYENKRYRQHAATSFRIVIQNLNVQISDLTDEIDNSKRKLRQPWRIFGRSKLQKHIEKNNTLRTALVGTAMKVQEEIDRAEKFL